MACVPSATVFLTITIFTIEENLGSSLLTQARQGQVPTGQNCHHHPPPHSHCSQRRSSRLHYLTSLLHLNTSDADQVCTWWWWLSITPNKGKETDLHTVRRYTCTSVFYLMRLSCHMRPPYVTWDGCIQTFKLAGTDKGR